MSLSSFKFIKSFLIFINNKLEIKKVKEYVNRLQIKLKSINDTITTLSGGNQQKVILSKLLMAKAKVLLLDEPTSGIDVNTKIQFFDYMADYVKKGGSIIFVTAELYELMLVCHRILVIRNGEITKEIKNIENTKEEDIFKLISA